MSRKFSDSSSQELRRDVFNFRFPPLESSGRHWFDPSSLSSSQESKRFSLSRTREERKGGFRNSKKVKTIDVDSEPHASCSTQDSQGLEVFEFSDEGSQKSQSLKKAEGDPFEYNSSEELEGQKGRESQVFEFSEDVDFQKSKKLKKAVINPFEYNSSEGLEGKKGRESQVFEFSEDVDFQKSKNLKKAVINPFEYNSSEGLEGKKGRESRVFKFSEDVDFKKPKKLKKAVFNPYEYNSSEELGQKGRESQVFEFSEDVDFKKSKKLKKAVFNPYEYKSSEELEGVVAPLQRKSKELEIFDFSKDVDILISKKLKKADFYPSEYNSSEELEGIVAPYQRKSIEIDTFDFSEDVDFQKSKKLKKVDFSPYEYISSEELEGSEVPLENKSKKNGVFDTLEDVDLQESQKLKKTDLDPYEYISSEELEEIVAPPRRKSKEIEVFDFSEDKDSGKSKKCKNVGSNTFMRSPSQNFFGLGIPRPRKHASSELSAELDGVSVKSKKKDRGENGVIEKKKKKKRRESRESDPGYIELTDILMETQEFGKTTEHIDDVSLALDGLKEGQPLTKRRASLLSLLSICRTLQKRRLLWAHGNARKVINAILGISVDDTPSNLAAAALFYLFISDGQDEHLLYSPNSVSFLIKLLKPLSSAVAKEKSRPIGSKLLGLCKNAVCSQNSSKETDYTTTEIMLKVREVLVNNKEMKPVDDSGGGKQEPELNPKWITLLTIEKACSSSICIEGFEDTSRTLQRARGNFKKKLREFGGLDAVFEVARKCHSVMEEWLEKSPSFSVEPKNISGLESLVLLVKCLKIMENATFLSNDNQCHLLAMKGSFGVQQAPRSFTKLILSIIKILSGVSLLRSSISYESSHSEGLSSMEQSPYLSVEATWVSSQKGIVESSQARLCSGTSSTSDYVTHASRDEFRVEAGTGKGKLALANSGITEDSPDPFVFDEGDSVPSKWESQYGSIKPLPRDGRPPVVRLSDTSDYIPASQQESNNVEYHHSQETSSSSLVVDEDKSNLLADCLLTAVKVLMNLSNDNPEGCRQIGSIGGLEILSSLITGHFPSFSQPLQLSQHARNGSLSSKSSLTIYHCSNTPLTDQELDFLVAILGLLVNLVEKDGGNRSRLAAASVSIPNLVGLQLEKQSNMIPILCSIFLANRGTSEDAGEEKTLSWEDEESILQGEKEAEKMIVEAYAALLLAFLSTESKKVRNTIAECLPDRSLKILVPVLERFVEFHLTLNVISPETHSAVLEVIESCKMP